MNKEQGSIYLALTEVFIGGIGHALMFPFVGQALSLNQLFILANVVQHHRGRFTAAKDVVEVSSMTSVLKSLSPAGKKLTPMLAIFFQGILFSIGLVIGGKNRLGIIIGAGLSGLWAFIQPAAIALLFFGKDFFNEVIRMITLFGSKNGVDEKILYWIVIGILLGKIFLSIGFGLWGYQSSQNMKAYMNVLEQIWNRFGIRPLIASRRTDHLVVQEKQIPSPLKGSVADLFSFWFIVGFIINAFILYRYSSLDTAKYWIMVMRPVGIAWLFFWLIRSSPRWLVHLVKQKFPGLVRVADKVKEFGKLNYG